MGGSGLGPFEQPEGTPCRCGARKPLSCGDTASHSFKYLSPNQSGAEKPANIMCCRWISDGLRTASWVWHGLIPLVFAGYLPSQQPDICGVNHFQLFHRRKLSSSINNNSFPTGVSVFACGSGALLLPFSPPPSTSSPGKGYEVPATDQSWTEKKRCQLFSLNFCLYPYTGHKWTMLQKAIEILGQK